MPCATPGLLETFEPRKPGQKIVSDLGDIAGFANWSSIVPP
jgi:hypothetical protein